MASKKRSSIKWGTYAGGTGAHHGSSYAAYTAIGSYHINPPSRARGKWHLTWANNSGLGLEGVHGGLWHDLGSFASPNAAKKIANEHHARMKILAAVKGSR